MLPSQIGFLQKTYGLAVVSLLFWFANNITTVILNKVIFTNYLFVFPLTLTAIHMAVCSVGAFLVLRVFQLVPYQPIASNFFWQRIFPLSFIFILNIIMGNVSIKHIPVSFMQTVKSSVPAFTVLLEAIFFASHSKRHDVKIYLSLVPIVGGILFATWTEVNFEMIGFATAVVGSVFTALQTIVSSIVMTQKLNAINLTYYMAPPSFVIILPLCLYYELDNLKTWKYLYEPESCFVLILSGSIAFLLNISTFFAIHNTSPLTFTIAGNFKVILSILFSVMIFRNEITLLNAMGCAVALGGVAWYNQIRYEENVHRATQEKLEKENQQKEAESMGPSNLETGQDLKEQHDVNISSDNNNNEKSTA